MKHITALTVKFIFIAAVSEIILSIFTNLNIRQILFLALVITAVTYLMGDLLILSVFNNATAAVGDAGLCWLIIYLGNYFWPTGKVSLLSALSAAAVIGIGEIFLHKYMEAHILKDCIHGPNAIE